MDGWISMIYRYEETRLEIQEIRVQKYCFVLSQSFFEFSYYLFIFNKYCFVLGVWSSNIYLHYFYDSFT